MSCSLVSVIVPVYNASRYLVRCLESLVGQTYRNLEIICVNDGSVDNSGEILDVYAAQDARIKVIHQKNAGVSAARNAGLDVATGEYVAFVDSDDWLELNAISLVMDCFAGDIDFVCMGVDVNGDEAFRAELQDYCNFFPKRRVKVTPALFRHGNLTLWNKIYRMELIHRNGLRFLRGISYGEDVAFVCSVIVHCRNVTGIATKCYHYVLQPDSLMHKEDRQFRMAVDLFAAWNSVCEYYFHNRLEKRFWPMLERMFTELHYFAQEWPPRNGEFCKKIWELVKRCGLDRRSSYPGIVQLRDVFQPPWVQMFYWVKENRVCYGVCGHALLSIAYEDGFRIYRFVGRHVITVREV